MLVWGLNAGEVRTVVEHVSTEKYGGNVTFGRMNTPLRDESGPRGKRARFTLGVNDSHGTGARRSWSGRHTVAATWQAHYDVMAALFDAGATRIRSAMADYRAGMAQVRTSGYSLDDRGQMLRRGPFATARDAFDALADETADGNAGSIMAPVAFGDL